MRALRTTIGRLKYASVAVSPDASTGTVSVDPEDGTGACAVRTPQASATLSATIARSPDDLIMDAVYTGNRRTGMSWDARE
jgi:hypothetical protein